MAVLAAPVTLSYSCIQARHAQSIESLPQIGQIPKGGVRRIAYSPFTESIANFTSTTSLSSLSLRFAHQLSW